MINDYGIEDDSENEDTNNVNEYKRQISLLRTQLEISERKLVNAKYLNESQDTYVQQVQEKERESSEVAKKYKRNYHKLREKYNDLQANIRIRRHESILENLEYQKWTLQKAIQGILETTPNLELPIHSKQRRTLKSYQRNLVKLEKRLSNQQTLLSQQLQQRMLLSEMKKAVVRGDLSTVQSLLNRDVGINMLISEVDEDDTGENSMTAFQLACRSGQYEIVKEMIPIADIQGSVCPNSLMTPLHLSVQSGNPTVVKLLLMQEKNHSLNVNVKNNLGHTPLHTACMKKNKDCINLLLDLVDINLNVQDFRGNTPLHHCCELYMHFENIDEILCKMLQKGANPRIMNIEGLSPMILAAKQRHTNLTELFNNYSTCQH